MPALLDRHREKLCLDEGATAIGPPRSQVGVRVSMHHVEGSNNRFALNPLPPNIERILMLLG
jgi:hypothetical protein